MIAFFLYLYFFTASWGGAFTLGPWFPLHVVFLSAACMLALPGLLAKRNFPRQIYHFEDIFICLGIMAIMVSGLLYPNDKTFRYITAYFYIFGAGYFGLKYLLYQYVSLDKVLGVNTIAVLFIAGFAITDVALYSFAGLRIRESLPGLVHLAQTYHGNISRAYALAIEPGNLAFYLNTMGILAIWKLLSIGLKKRKLFILAFTALIIAAWICTFSAAGVIFMIVAIIATVAIKLIIVFITGKNKLPPVSEEVNATLPKEHFLSVGRGIFNGRHAILIKFAILVSVAIIIFLSIKYSDSIRQFNLVEALIRKVSFEDESSIIRREKWIYAIENSSEDFWFGKGIGYLSDRGMGSSNNWYLFLKLEAGIIATASFVLFLLFTFIRIVRSGNILKYWFLAGFFAGVLHLNVISTIHEPGLWILIALFNVVEQKHTAGEKLPPFSL